MSSGDSYQTGRQPLPEHRETHPLQQVNPYDPVAFRTLEHPNSQPPFSINNPMSTPAAPQTSVAESSRSAAYPQGLMFEPPTGRGGVSRVSKEEAAKIKAAKAKERKERYKKNNPDGYKNNIKNSSKKRKEKKQGEDKGRPAPAADQAGNDASGYYSLSRTPQVLRIGALDSYLFSKRQRLHNFLSSS